jgi:DNA polymerase type B, organellar and viral
MKPISVCAIATENPLTAAYYDGSSTAIWEDDNCVRMLAEHIAKQPGARIVYCRDGGREAFYHLLSQIDRGEMSIIDSRILRCRIGPHQLRDSWGITPFPLAPPGIKFNDISDELEAEYELCSRFTDEFGQYLTVGAVAARELSRSCPFWRGDEGYDAEWRKFYFGGRNEIYKTGIVEGDIREYDISSAFPAVMRNLKHPTGTAVMVGDKITKGTFFVTCRGRNHGAFPFRRQWNQSLSFSQQEGEFHVTRHEFDAAEETGTFECDKITATYSWKTHQTFRPFVDPLYGKRLKAKRIGDYWGDMIYKTVLNAAYGKFAQNPSRYSDYYLTGYGYYPPNAGPWVPACTHLSRFGHYMLWQKPARHYAWFNIATAASITGAARASLLRGIQAAKYPLYCDTDSVICDGDASLQLGDGLGQWKLEHRGTSAALVRKKTYALFDGERCLKTAHAGCELSPNEILRAARGERIVKTDPRPTYHISGRSEFRRYTISRE